MGNDGTRCRGYRVGHPPTAIAHFDVQSPKGHVSAMWWRLRSGCTPAFADEKFLRPTRNSRQRDRGHTRKR